MQADIRQINLGIIGTGWCGGIPAVAAAASPWVNELHIAEIREERLKEVAELAKPATATTDYRKLIENPSIGAVMISTTPEPTHYPIAKESLLAGKHVFLEKPIALLAEADELIALAASKKLVFTIGYSRRFNPKFAYVKRSSEDGTIGEPCSALFSRHITRNLGKKIGGGSARAPLGSHRNERQDLCLRRFHGGGKSETWRHGLRLITHLNTTLGTIRGKHWRPCRPSVERP